MSKEILKIANEIKVDLSNIEQEPCNLHIKDVRLGRISDGLQNYILSTENPKAEHFAAFRRKWIEDKNTNNLIIKTKH